MRPSLRSSSLAVALWSSSVLAQGAPAHPEGIERAMPTGVIEGGMAYVYAAYVLGVFGLLLYGLSLWVRRPTGDGGHAS